LLRRGDPVDKPITLADVDRRIRQAFDAERKNNERMLADFANQLNQDLEKIVLMLTGEINELERVLVELRAIQGKPLASTPPPRPHLLTVLANAPYVTADIGNGLISHRHPPRLALLLRLPTRGALGNGLRIVAGAVCGCAR
jgi:hypothetical protein